MHCVVWRVYQNEIVVSSFLVKHTPHSGSVRTRVYQEVTPMAVALVFFLMKMLIFSFIFAKNGQLEFDSW